MSQDGGDRSKNKDQARTHQVERSKSQYSSWLSLPTPIKRVFDQFPLQTYPANKPSEELAFSRAEHRLYIFSSPQASRLGRPSYNPGCLKWQAYLHAQDVQFKCVPSSNHASPTGALPFLLPAQTGSELSSTVPSNKIASWTRTNRSEKEPRNQDTTQGKSGLQDETSSLMRQEAYMALVDHPIRNAYLHSLYLCSQNFDSIVAPLYIKSTTSNGLVRLVLGQQLRSAAQAELLKVSKMIDVDKLYDESARAFLALSTLLGEDDFFHGTARPGLLDASVFAYVHLLLDETLDWQDRRLSEQVGKFKNLQEHRNRILEMYFKSEQ